MHFPMANLSSFSLFLDVFPSLGEFRGFQHLLGQDYGKSLSCSIIIFKITIAVTQSIIVQKLIFISIFSNLEPRFKSIFTKTQILQFRTLEYNLPKHIYPSSCSISIDHSKLNTDSHNNALIFRLHPGQTCQLYKILIAIHEISNPFLFAVVSLPPPGLLFVQLEKRSTTEIHLCCKRSMDHISWGNVLQP